MSSDGTSTRWSLAPADKPPTGVADGSGRLQGPAQRFPDGGRKT
jgi:hypothetical protein